MSLRPCRACGREIATSAPACPHCGAPGRSFAGAVHRTWHVVSAWGCVLYLVLSLAGVVLLYAQMRGWWP